MYLCLQIDKEDIYNMSKYNKQNTSILRFELIKEPNSRQLKVGKVERKEQ